MMHPASVSATLPHPSMGATPIFTSPLGAIPQVRSPEVLSRSILTNACHGAL